MAEGIKADEILYSPLLRAADTAKHISEMTGIQAQMEPRLIEQNFGGCFVAMGTKSYFYRDGRRVSNGVVYNNDSNVLTVRDEEEAYDKIAEELGVKTLKLGYMPEGMRFQDVTIGIGYGKLRYEYKNERITFIQAKSSLKTSMMY